MYPDRCRAGEAGVIMTSTRAGHVVGGRYRLVAELGVGGFGRVWQARDEALDVDVAIKELWLLPGMSQAEQAERLARATREARNAARLRKHENIVAIHDIVVEDSLPWIVMDLIDGRSLDEHIKEHGPLPVDRAAHVAAALLAAVGAAHQEGVVHRDIKPANVMLAANGKVLLTDFGIAVHATDTALTATGMVVGSLEYTAPERLRGTDGLPASDLFSVGVTLYQAVEGISPFRRDTPSATLTAVLMDQVPAPRRAGPLTQVITQLLDKEPGARPTVREALDLTDVPIGNLTDPFDAPTDATPHDTKIHTGPQDARLTSWHKPIAALVALIVMLVAVGLAEDVSLLQRFEPLVSVVVSIDALLAGVLCAGIARLVPESTSQAVTVIVGVAGFLLGGGAGFFAVVGILQHFTMGLGFGAMVSPTGVFIVLLVAIGWAWAVRKPRRPSPTSERRGR
jgi:serine/threonine protein kinase